MELHMVFLVCFSTLLFLLRLLAREASKPNRKANLPPGPPKLPLIGNIHNLISSHPHRRLRDVAKTYGPLMQLQLGEVPTVVVSSAKIAKEIMKTYDVIFSQRPFLLASRVLSYGSLNIVFSGYNGYWRQLRKICMMELMSAKRVESFRHIREQEVGALANVIYSNKNSPINLSKMIFWTTYSILSKAAFGSECRDQEALISLVAEAIGVASGFCLADMYPSKKLLHAITGLRLRLEKMHARSDKILQEIVDDHKRSRRWETATTGDAKGREDLVDVLLRLQHHGDLEYPFTDDNIKAVILDIIVAGCETTATTVEWALSELLRNPELMKRAQNEVRQVFDRQGKVNETGLHELKFLKSVIKETLRLHPSGPLLVPRECSEDCVINGYDVPAKTKLIVNAWAIQRDPDCWKEPERFDPDRFLERSVDFNGTDLGYMPFGWGRRVCPGILFAVPDVVLPLATILYHFDWEMADGTNPEDLDLTETFGLTVRIKKKLILVPVVRRPLISSAG